MTGSSISIKRTLSAFAVSTALLASQGFGQEAAQKAPDLAAAQVALVEGDEAYLAGDFALATERFGEALLSAPTSGTVTAALKERYAQAAIENAKSLTQIGAYGEARALLNRVLSDDIDPNSAEARKALEELDDPIRTNPALTVEHSQNIERVAKLLRTAQGEFDLGNFERALLTYEDVLRVDPYNKAARRGMEAASVKTSEYAEAAYDHTRAKLMAEVDAAWELDPGDSEENVARLLGGGESPLVASSSVQELLSTVILPQINLQEATLSEAVDYLRVQTQLLDPRDLSEEAKGVSFVLNGSAEMRNQVVNLNLRNVPLSAALDFLTNTTRTSYKVSDFAVEIFDRGADDGEFSTRSFTVPPDFLSRGAIGPAEGNDDPFATPDANQSLIPKQLTAQEFLERQGVDFGEGGFARFLPSNGTLTVRANRANLEIVEQIVNGIAGQQPIVVRISTTIMDVQQENVAELGFDHFLRGGTGGDFRLSGGSPFESGTQANLPDANGLVDQIVQEGFPDAPAVTNGLRTGGQALNSDSIDGLLNSSNTGEQQAVEPAPGILQFTKVDPTQVGGLNLLISRYAGVLRGRENKRAVDVVSQPSVLTRPGQVASIRSVREFIYPTEYEPPELPNSVGSDGVVLEFLNGVLVNVIFPDPPPLAVTPATPTAFEMREVGTVLEAEATVGADNKTISLSLKPSITEFEGFVNYGSPILGESRLNPLTLGQPEVLTENQILQPIFSVLTEETSLTIEDGAMIAIGGLLSSQIEDVEDSVPILGDLPLVGRFFKSDAKQTNRRAVFIFVTVDLLDPTGRKINP